jgi:hypothetical protein
MLCVPAQSGCWTPHWIWVVPAFTSIASRSQWCWCSTPKCGFKHSHLWKTLAHSYFIPSFPFVNLLITEWQADFVHHNVARPEWQQEPFSESCNFTGPRSVRAFSLSETGKSEPTYPDYKSVPVIIHTTRFFVDIELLSWTVKEVNLLCNLVFFIAIEIW